MSWYLCELVLAANLFGDAFDGVMGGEDGALLPADEVREVISGEVGLALWFFELLVGWLAAVEVIVGEAAEGVGDFGPADIDGLG